MRAFCFLHPHVCSHFLARALSLAVILLGPPAVADAAAAHGRAPARQSSSSPNLTTLRRCRGDTHAHVTIRWPDARELAFDRRLRWRHVPRSVRRWGYLIVPAARANGVDPYLVAGIMRVESDGDPLIWNLDSDARGLMQVLHAPFQPATNIGLGVSMLGQLLRQFGARDLAIAGYNAGPGAVQAYGGIPPYTETRDYVVMVDYYRDFYAGLHLSHERIARFKAAVRDLVAYYRRICG